MLFVLPYFVGCVTAFGKIRKVLEPFFYSAFYFSYDISETHQTKRVCILDGSVFLEIFHELLLNLKNVLPSLLPLNRCLLSCTEVQFSFCSFCKSILLFHFPVLSCFLFCLYKILYSAQLPLLAAVFVWLIKPQCLIFIWNYFPALIFMSNIWPDYLSNSCRYRFSGMYLWTVFKSNGNFSDYLFRGCHSFQLLNSYIYFPKGLQDESFFLFCLFHLNFIFILNCVNSLLGFMKSVFFSFFK